MVVLTSMVGPQNHGLFARCIHFRKPGEATLTHPPVKWYRPLSKLLDRTTLVTLATVRRVALFSNLNLNGRAPLRAQPQVGTWGPEGVPSTRAKKRMRIWVSLACAVAITVICLLGYHFFKLLS